MYQIIDLNGKARNVEYVKRFMHPVPDRISGEMLDVPYIEVMIHGKTRQWVEWYPAKEFEVANPSFIDYTER